MGAKRVANGIVTGCCLGIIFFFSISYWIVPARKNSELESRSLARFPELTTFSQLASGEWMRRFETFLIDQVFEREHLVLLAKKIQANLELGKQVGKYFLGENGQLLEPFNPAVSFSAQYVDKLFGRVDIPVTILLVPAKSEVYSAYLPPYYGGRIKTKYMHLDHELGKVTNENVSFVYLFKTKWNNPAKRMYYETDHHWTQYGSFLAYSLFMQHAGYDPLPENYFKFELVSSCFLGAMARQAFSDQVCSNYYGIVNYEDYNVQNDYKGKWEKGLKRSNLKFGKWGNYYQFLGPERYFSRAKKYGTWMYVNEEPIVDEKVLVLGNSMVVGILPWLAVTFQEVHRWDLRDNIGENSISSYVRRKGIDRIIYVGYENNLKASPGYFYEP